MTRALHSGAALAALFLTSAIALPASGIAAESSQTRQSPWALRLRATYLWTQDKSDAFSALGIDFEDNVVDVSDKWIPEIDVAYRFTRNLTAELVLTLPQKHTVDLEGVGPIGSFRHLPPTLLAQWHFLPDASIRPYVGAGVNLTLITNTKLDIPGTGVGLDLENYSVGPAAQAGVDISLSESFDLNIDLKWAMIRSDVTVSGTDIKLTQAKLDPFMASLGVAYRF